MNDFYPDEDDEFDLERDEETPWDGRLVPIIEDQVLVIQANPMKKEGAPMGEFTCFGRNYLVFLPDNLPIGQLGHFRLVSMPQLDGRGQQMFEGTPLAPRLVKNVWVEIGSNVLRCDVEYDYLDRIRLIPTVHEQRLAKTEKTVKDQVVIYPWMIWGDDLGTSRVSQIVREIRVVSRETVEAGRLTTRRLPNEEVEMELDRFSVSRFKAEETESWLRGRMALEVAPDLDLRLEVTYRLYGRAVNVRLRITWAELPSWLREELLTDTPICACGRGRFLKKNGQCARCLTDKAARRAGNISARTLAVRERRPVI